MEMNPFHNPMRENAYDVPGLLQSQCARIEQDSRMVLTTPEIFEFRRIIVTGCGDSYAAGLAMKPAMETLIGLPVEVLPAMHLARYSPPDVFGKPGSTLVIAVSNSGAVTRVAEAVQRATHYGCLTLAVTAKPESALAKAACKRVLLDIPKFAAGGGNGIRSYRISMLSLLLVAIRIGEVKCRYMMTDSEKYRSAICGYAAAFDAALPALDAQMLRLAQANTDKELFDFLGSGGSFGTAWFSHAKIIEATGDYASYSDLESWMHLNCFFRELPKKFTMIYAGATGADRSRAEEAIQVIGQMKGTLCVVTDSADYPLPESAERILIPACPFDWLAPLLSDIPLSLLAGYLCELKHETYGRDGQEDWKAIAGTGLLTNSKFVLI